MNQAAKYYMGHLYTVRPIRHFPDQHDAIVSIVRHLYGKKISLLACNQIIYALNRRWFRPFAWSEKRTHKLVKGVYEFLEG